MESQGPPSKEGQHVSGPIDHPEENVTSQTKNDRSQQLMSYCSKHVAKALLQLEEVLNTTVTASAEARYSPPASAAPRLDEHRQREEQQWTEDEVVYVCPPPLVLSAETGECEEPCLGENIPLESKAASSGRKPCSKRPKFRVCGRIQRGPDDGELLVAVATLARNLETSDKILSGNTSAPGVLKQDLRLQEPLASVPGGCVAVDDVGEDHDGAVVEVAMVVSEAKAATCAAVCMDSKVQSNGPVGAPDYSPEPKGRAETVDDGAKSNTGQENGAAAAAAAVAAGKKGGAGGAGGAGRAGGRVASLEDAIRATGHGWFHVRLLLVSGGLVMAAVLEAVVVGYLLPVASRELNMTDDEKGFLGAATHAGVVMSSHTWGLLADTLGRKRALIWATLLDVVASLASSLSPNFGTLIALRLCCGLFSSAPAALSFAYLCEFHTPATRSRAMLWIGAFPSLGLIVLPGVAWAVLPQCWFLDLGFVRFSPWRLLLVLCGSLSLMSALSLMFGAPESPKFLATRNPKEALSVLRHMYAVNTGRPEDDYPVDDLLDSSRPSVSTVELELTPRTAPGPAPGPAPSLGLQRSLVVVWQQTVPLFKPPYLLHTFLVCILQFGNLASANGLQIWLPDIFNKLADFEYKHPSEAASICASQAAFVDDGHVDVGTCVPINEAVFRNNLIIGAASLAMPIVCGLVVNFVGKRNLLVLCLLVSGTFGVLLSIVKSTSLLLALASVIVAINSMGIGHISSIVVELFPTNFRAMAVSLHMMVGRSGSVVGNVLFGALLRTHCEFTFYAIGGALLVCAVLSCFLPARGKYAS